MSARRAKATAITDPQESAAGALIELPSNSAKPLKTPGGDHAAILAKPQGRRSDRRRSDPGRLRGHLARMHVTDAAGKAVTLSMRHPDGLRW